MNTTPTPAGADLPQGALTDALQELHDLLFTAQRTSGAAQKKAIGLARLALHKLRESTAVACADLDLSEDGAIWQAIFKWHKAASSSFVTGGVSSSAFGVDEAIRAALAARPGATAAAGVPVETFRALLRAEIDAVIDVSGDVARQEAQIDQADHLLVKFNELFPEAS